MFNSRLNKIESKVDITYKKAILNSDKCTDYLYYLDKCTRQKYNDKLNNKLSVLVKSVNNRLKLYSKRYL